MRFQSTQTTAPGFNLAELSTPKLEEMAKNKDLAAFLPAIQTELARRTKPKATLVVQILRNSNVKPVPDSGMSRIQATVISAKFENARPGDELTFGFGENFETAQLGVFLLFPDEQLERLNLALSTQVTVEVALTVNPVNNSYFVLTAGEINELRPVFNEETRRNQTMQVWVGPEGEEVVSKTCPEEGYVASTIPTYSNVSVLDILDVVTVNLALTNSIIPEDTKAWLQQATKKVANARQKSLAVYQQKRNAIREEEGRPQNPNVAAMAATLEDKELEVKI